LIPPGKAGKMSKQKKAHIETFGCQMNDRDSEIMGQLLENSGYELVNEIKKAHLVVVNTCSIRGKAEQKALSLLGRLKILKKKNPLLKIAVAGCVAQQEGEKLISRMNYIDLVFGPQHIYQLPELINSLESKLPQRVVCELNKNFVIPPFLPEMENLLPHKRFVTIMQGCNNFCTYCVVPFTRGREISRKPEDIINEIVHLMAQGVTEITLLGQNVNSYGLDMDKDRQIKFYELIEKVHGIDKLERIRFTTSNPKDLSNELINSFKTLPKLCHHFHLPVQSGSNNILKRMNRKYTIELYLEQIDALRQACPEIAITTDIIVGFPGETDNDFEETMNLLEKVQYHSAFSFKYSDRPHTQSINFSNKINEEVKKERLSRLQSRQQEITLARNNEYIGKTVAVVVEGQSKNAAGQWSGRTGTNHIVNFRSPDLLNYGQKKMVKIEQGCLHSLLGVLIN
jgi:tRNA-2-methylthio-N6-dimethylallyladenosine synthase